MHGCEDDSEPSCPLPLNPKHWMTSAFSITRVGGRWGGGRGGVWRVGGVWRGGGRAWGSGAGALRGRAGRGEVGECGGGGGRAWGQWAGVEGQGRGHLGRAVLVQPGGLLDSGGALEERKGRGDECECE